MDRELLAESLRGTARCPGTAELGEYLEGRADSLRDHVTSCPQCEAELAMMRELTEGSIQPHEQADVRWVSSRIRPVTAAETAAAPWWRAWFRWSPALAALLVVISVGLYTRNFREPGEVRYGGAGELRSSRIEVKSPVGTVASKPASFAWQAVSGAARYEVAVEEVDGNVVWKGSANAASAAIPAEVTAKMLPGKTLLWRVKAFDAAGSVVAESEASRFRMESGR